MDCVYAGKSYFIASLGFSSKWISATVVIKSDLVFDVFYCEKIMTKKLYQLIVSGEEITCPLEVTNLMAFIHSFNVNQELTGHLPVAVAGS